MDSSFPSRRLTAASLVTGAFTMGTGLALTPWEDERTTAAFHDAIAAQPGRAQVAALVLHAGFLLIALGALGMVAAAGGRGGWWTRIGAVLAVVGLMTLPGLLITDAYELALAQELDRATGVRVSDAAAGTPLAVLLTAPAGIGLMLGTLALTLGLWRAGEVPAAAAVLVFAGWAVPLAGFDLVLTMAGAALFTAGCALVAARLAGLERRGTAAVQVASGG